MVESVKEMVIDLSREEIIDSLGDPQPNTDGILHAPSTAIVYIIQFRGFRHEFLIIHFDENDIAIEVFIIRQ